MGLASHPVVIAAPAATVAAAVVVMAEAVVETPLVVEAASYCWLHEPEFARARSGNKVAAPGCLI